jgi:hemerythrin
MSYFEWKDSLQIGIKTIDDQHRHLVALIDELHDTATRPEQYSVPEVLARLRIYATEHFHVEEGYMQAFAYPEFTAHLKEHEGFCAAVQCFEKSYADGSAHPAELLEFLKSWFTNHILDVDMRMGRFLDDYL